MGVTQPEICSELTDLRHRLEFYQEHVFYAPHAEEALARQLAENARQQAEILELRKQLALYTEFCVCLGQSYENARQEAEILELRKQLALYTECCVCLGQSSGL
jgi:hypothetical protein